MDIAAMSIDMSLTKVQSSVGVAMMKEMMNMQQVEANAIEQLLQTSAAPAPSFGHALDILA